MTGARRIHAQLHLLDRQVVLAGDGHLLCKVDDLELGHDAEGRPYLTAILYGPLALGPRIGGVPGRLMVAVTSLLRPETHPEPQRVPMVLVTEIGSAVTVAGRQAEPALERWARKNIIAKIPGSGDGDGGEGGRDDGDDTGRSGGGGRRGGEGGEGRPPRVSDLIGRPVVDSGGRQVGQVADVRFDQDGPLIEEVRNAFRLNGLIVVPRHTGRLFGYERGPGGRAPWLVREVIRRLHRNSRFATWSQIATLGGETVRLSVPVGELSPLRELYEPDPS
ncbi:PRC-barrel domain-containing protein [Streptosporangium sp. NPDC006930]|uniref:PRC-barrel domain-containing protein n=1 Tax=unclassified Streptosporangium TaxID=2632669 RepID=UPI003429E522